MKTQRFVWLDLETTGLHPQLDAVLEVGIIITDKGLREIARKNWLVKPYFGSSRDRAPWDLEAWEEWPRTTHMKSGLIADVMANGVQRDVAEEQICEWIRVKSDISVGVGAIYTLAGFSVHFDRDFLHSRMPNLHKMFSHRLLDVSAFKIAARAWYGQAAEHVWYEKGKQVEVHRAIPDCEEAIRTLEKIRTYIFRTGQQLDAKIRGHEAG